MTSIEERKRKYIEENKGINNIYALILNAYENENININIYNDCIKKYISNKENKKDNDFEMLILIRILYLSKINKNEQNLMIYETLTEIFKEQQFWLSKNETTECFWSENHMICYLSSWYLWNQYNDINDEKCDILLNTFLETKQKYFYYEFFSQVYNMYTLNALINIYDFTNNIEIKNKTKRCIEIILQQFSEVITLNGTMYCASGRSYNRCKISSLDHNCNKLMYLLTGYCKEMDISPVGVFFATSSFMPDKYIMNDYHNKYEKIYNISHSENEFKNIYKHLSKYDRTIFQWSAGNYFNSENVDDTIKLINDYNLWGHSHFKLEPYDTILKLIPRNLLVSTTEMFKVFTDGSPLCNIKYHIYNNKYYSLTSIENYNKGNLGAQQFTWVANVGGVPVFTQSGKISTIGDLHEVIGNSHLPYIIQKQNVIMIMYKQSDIMKTVSSKAKLDLNVYLNWSGFDNEIRFVNEKWFFGEKMTNNKNVFVAVYSTDDVKEDINKNIYNENELQGWVAILGDDEEYNNLTEFKDAILNNCDVTFKKIKSKNVFSRLFKSNVKYYGKVSFKDINIDMTW